MRSGGVRSVWSSVAVIKVLSSLVGSGPEAGCAEPSTVGKIRVQMSEKQIEGGALVAIGLLQKDARPIWTAPAATVVIGYPNGKTIENVLGVGNSLSGAETCHE